MNGTELYSTVQKKIASTEGMPTDITKSVVEAVVKATISAIVDQVKIGDTVEIRDFGKFGMRERAAHTAKNPATGAAVQVPAKNKLTFKPSKALDASLPVPTT